MNSQIIEITSKRRDKLDIIAEITQISKEGALKTQIMYKANLSFAQLNDYLKLLINLKLLQKTQNQGKDLYIVTQKGLNFLQRHQEIMDLLCETQTAKNGMKIPPYALLKKD
jgi:predicted transcriptional regulator